ncbi:2'-5' RNA ligase [Achromobacter xylosoxidans]
MANWPFPNIAPEDWADLPAGDKAMLEALTAAYLAELARQRALEPNVSNPDH